MDKYDDYFYLFLYLYIAERLINKGFALISLKHLNKKNALLAQSI